MCLKLLQLECSVVYSVFENILGALILKCLHSILSSRSLLPSFR